MSKRLFSFKIEELVVIAAVILASVRKDIADFAAFSSVFISPILRLSPLCLLLNFWMQ